MTSSGRHRSLTGLASQALSSLFGFRVVRSENFQRLNEAARERKALVRERDALVRERDALVRETDALDDADFKTDLAQIFKTDLVQRGIESFLADDWLKYFSDRRRFIRLGGEITHRYPIVSEYRHESGTAKGHYFHQDLLVASFIHRANPKRHIDVGSRVNGFVAHVASFRPIEVLDVRPLSDTGHPNISFLQADLMVESKALPKSDSISCLHAIEHFGLGRYGDSVDPEGHKKGFSNILSMLEQDGTFYISAPIGRSNEVHFNAHRVFHPLDILNWPGNISLKLERFDYIDDSGALHQNVDLQKEPMALTHGCGIYTFKKLAD